MRDAASRFGFSAGSGWVQTASAEDCGRYCDVRVSLAPALVCAQQPLVALASEIEVRLSSRLVVLRHQKQAQLVPFEISLPREVLPDDSTVKWHRRAHELRLSLPWRAGAISDGAVAEEKLEEISSSATFTGALSDDSVLGYISNGDPEVHACSIFKVSGLAESDSRIRAPEIDHPAPHFDFAAAPSCPATHQESEIQDKDLNHHCTISLEAAASRVGCGDRQAEMDFSSLQRISCFSLYSGTDDFGCPASRNNAAAQEDTAATVGHSLDDGLNSAAGYGPMLRNSFLDFSCPPPAASQRRRSQSAGAQTAADTESAAFARYVNTYHFHAAQMPQKSKTDLAPSGWTPSILLPGSEAREFAAAAAYADIEDDPLVSAAVSPQSQTLQQTSRCEEKPSNLPLYLDWPCCDHLGAQAMPEIVQSFPQTPPSPKLLDVNDLLLQHCKDTHQETTQQPRDCRAPLEKRRMRRSIKKRAPQTDKMSWGKTDIFCSGTKGTSASNFKEDRALTRFDPALPVDRGAAMTTNATRLQDAGNANAASPAKMPSTGRLQTWQPSLRHRCVAAMHTPSITCC
mmetsp:Transcript_138253/g.258018  ORF Transcript_138253/g.258018 Transcript_138253/m.258018 type:complete len:571 (+) Transcript_138253:61-1773(+)